jgi:membrane protease YdiL (CAAX protease family)
MWAPGIAALVTCRARRIDIGFLSLSRFDLGYVFIGYLVVVGYAVLPFAALWLTRLAPLDWRHFSTASAKLYDPLLGAPLLAILFTMTFGVVQSGASALGEEIGWRGFLFPALNSRIGLVWTCLLSGLIWAAWHFPLIIFADYGGGTPLPFQLACFTVMIISTGTIYGLIRLKSRSVWPAVVMHAVHNALIQWLLDMMTVETGKGAWFAGEFGAALAVFTAIIAIVIFLRLRNDISVARDRPENADPD